MKKSILAVAIPALLAGNSAFAVDLLATDTSTVEFYGELRARISDVDDTRDVHLDAFLDAAGIAVTHNIAPGLDAVGLYEFGTDSDGSTTVNHKKAYVGLASDFGTVTFGKQNLPFDDLNAALGYDFDENGRIGVVEKSSDSSIDYEYADDMYWFNLAYSFPEGSDEDIEVMQVAVGVTVEGLSVQGGYSSQNGAIAADTYADSWLIQAAYAVGDVIVSGQYNEFENEFTGVDAEGYTLAGAYNYGMGYVFAGYEFSDESGSDTDFAYVGADYRFSDYARVFVEYGFEDSDAAGSDSLNKFNAGLRVFW